MGKSIVSFFSDEGAWTFAFVFSQLLFWLSGFPNGNDYGYDDDNKAADGSIPSGPAGSGVVVITTILMLVATGTLFSKFLKWNPNAAQEAKI